MLLLKTPGGSSFIWLLPNSLREDIPWFQLKVLFFLEIFAIAGFFILFFLLDLQFICVVPVHAYAITLMYLKYFYIY